MNVFKRRTTLILTLLLCAVSGVFAQHSVARRWNEALLNAIRQDFARPPVHARNLFHSSVALYDGWAVYDSVAETYLLGKTVGSYTCAFNGILVPADVRAAQEETMSYAVYRVLSRRFLTSPNVGNIQAQFNALMASLGYSTSFSSMDYSTGDAAALGNYLGQCVLELGFTDNSNEASNYAAPWYAPVNGFLEVEKAGNPTMVDANRWQPLRISTAIDQNGNPIPSNQVFQSPQWGDVRPFALTTNDLDIYQRGSHTFKVYHDPGPQPKLDTVNGGAISDEFVWNMSMVSAWGAHHDPTDGVMWDISPATIGNNTWYPQNLAEMHQFYKFTAGGDAGTGRPLNPKTGQPYVPQVVPRADFTRVLAQFWADGPNSETPPGHWYSIFNKAMEHPLFVRKFNGQGPVLSVLEYDVKAYFTLGGALHDAAISAWGIKGWYDASRPVSAIRYMDRLGQSSDPNLPRYHPGGIKIIPGLIEMVLSGDPLAGQGGVNIGKIKVYTFRGPQYVVNPNTQIAGVGWVLAQDFYTYQRKTFVTPPFGGYISGHSTYSRAAAEALTLLTGDEYFPGGLSEYKIEANSGFLGLEAGPTTDVTLQWATYRDASDQTSLSRIWGGIHPPFDDIPGRTIGATVGIAAYHKAKGIFYPDADGDGFVQADDCDDDNAAINPDATEICDNLDNDCNGTPDDGLPTNTFFTDADSDSFGNPDAPQTTCFAAPPAGQVYNPSDCDDTDPSINPAAAETCNDLDDNCNAAIDEGLAQNVAYADADHDGYGNENDQESTCQTTAPAGFVFNNSDCNDTDPATNPAAAEICNNLDDNCEGTLDEGLPVFTYFADNDDDAYGDIGNYVENCLDTPPAGFVTNDLDCNDADTSFQPAADEICDGLDNNCNDDIDDGLTFTVYFADTDGDTFGDVSTTETTCEDTPAAGFVFQSGDCDDGDPAINPNAFEDCDDIDNDCNALVDDALPHFTYFADSDQDGYGSLGDPTETCLTDAPAGFVANSDDCFDDSAAFSPVAPEVCDEFDNDCDGTADEGLPVFTWFADADNDNYGNSGETTQSCRPVAPFGYSTVGEDCEDANENINPGQPEICDDLDNDCSGVSDDGLTFHTYYYDADGDGFGVADITISSCLANAPDDFAAQSLDCDDTNAALNPGALEICDGLDNNCNNLEEEGLTFTNWYLDADGDGYGLQNSLQNNCQTAPPAGYAPVFGDCDETEPAINPGAAEICDDLDNDCDGLEDDGQPFTVYYADNDLDGFGNDDGGIAVTCFGITPDGFANTNNDCDDSDSAIHPAAAETCNAIDDNCNTTIDEGFTLITWFADADGDAFGDPSNEREECPDVILVGFVGNDLDCDDTNAAINPDAIEVLDNQDNDCNGLIDDGIIGTREPLTGARVWPNPVSGMLNISGVLSEAIFARLSDATGQTVLTKTRAAAGETVQLDCSALAPGVFFLQLEGLASGKRTVLRVVKI